jgi:hypothetical protein
MTACIIGEVHRGLRRTVLPIIAVAVTTVALSSSAHAQDAACGNIHVESYAPVVSACMDWGINRYPTKPILQNGQWIINDQNREFTLVHNARVDEHISKDAAMDFYRKTGVQVRFGVAQPLNDSDATQVFRDGHIGLYVESTRLEDWQFFDLPDGRPASRR